MGKASRKDIYVFVIIAILFSLYASVFIYKTSFVIGGERYFSLFDDGMISMRYAKNLVAGNGLVMNPGERVEGYTNPLWTIYMALIHLLPVARSKICLLIQITGIVLLVLNLFMVMKIARLISGNSFQVSSGAMILTAFYLPLINWSLQGMEVSLITLIVSIAVWGVIRCLRKKTFPLWLYILLGISTLVRIDMAVPFLGIWLFLIKVQPEYRKRNILWGLSIFAFFMGAQTLFRLFYYGDVLPSTYYLKMTGYPVFFRISRGVVVFVKFIWNLNIVLFLLPFIFLAVKYDNFRGIIAWVFVLQCLYSMYVGGDAWEQWGGSNRYISIVIPLFFILFSHAIYKTKEMFITILKNLKNAHKGVHSFCVRYCFPFLLILGLIQFNNNNGPLSLAGFVFINLPSNVSGNKDMVESALIIRDISTDDARIAVTWAGALPYFSERYTVDILGKTDTFIAHEEMRQTSGLGKFVYFYPGHLKYNYEYSIGKMKPDIIVQFWENSEEAAPYVINDYRKLDVRDWFFYLRSSSKNILWDRLPLME